MSDHHRQLADNAGEYFAAAAKVSPGVAVSATAAAGFDWNVLVLVGTALYLVLQIGYLLWKWRRDIRAERAGRAPHDD